jgi:co-chaperonin GroES (HSP10)
MLQPLNDIAIIIPLNPSLLELQKADRFGLNVREKTLEEYLRWRVIAAGPGVYSSTGTICPNPLKVGDVVICMTWTNQDIRERWDKVAELIHGQKCLAVRGFATENYLVVVDHISSE